MNVAASTSVGTFVHPTIFTVLVLLPQCYPRDVRCEGGHTAHWLRQVVPMLSVSPFPVTICHQADKD